MEAIGVAAANGQKTDFRFLAQRYECHRANLCGVVTEQELALGVTRLTTPGAFALQERAKGLEGVGACGLRTLRKPGNFSSFQIRAASVAQ